MTAAAAHYAWKEQSYRLADTFFVFEKSQVLDESNDIRKFVVVSERSKILNQKVGYDLYNTIRDYSKTGCSKLLHQIWQIVRFMLTFGNTQWSSTRSELTNVVKNDLRLIIAANLPYKVRAKIDSLIAADHKDKTDIEAKPNELRSAHTDKVVNAIIKQLDVKKAVNTLMLALLKLEKAGHVLDLNAKDTGLIEDTLAHSILNNNAKAYAKGFTKYLEPKDATEQKALRKESENFAGNTLLVDFIEGRIKAKREKQKNKEPDPV